MEETRRRPKETETPTLTGVFGEARSDADLQGLAGRPQHRHVSLTLDEQDLAGAAPAQEAPVLLFQLHLQSEEQKKGQRSAPGPGRPVTVTTTTPGRSSAHARVVELERQLPLSLLLEAASQQADELRLEDALQQAVVLLLVQDHEVVLHRAAGGNQPETSTQPTTKGGT